MRRFSIMSFVCVIVLFALTAGMAVATEEVGIYYWPPGTDGSDADLKVQEDVEWLVEPGIWQYRYTVTNLAYEPIAVNEWGYVMPGIAFTYVAAPVGWGYGPVMGTEDVAWHYLGLVDGDGNPIGSPIGEEYDFGQGSQDSFVIWSDGAPHHLYTGTAYGDDGLLGPSGLVSGPTPEPITMALLALGLPLGLLASRRRKED